MMAEDKSEVIAEGASQQKEQQEVKLDDKLANLNLATEERVTGADGDPQGVNEGADEDFYPAKDSFQEILQTAKTGAQDVGNAVASKASKGADVFKQSYVDSNPTSDPVSTVNMQSVPGTDETRDIPVEVVHETADTSHPGILSAVTGKIAQTVVSVKDALVGSKPVESGALPETEQGSNLVKGSQQQAESITNVVSEKVVAAKDLAQEQIEALTRSYPPHSEETRRDLNGETAVTSEKVGDMVSNATDTVDSELHDAATDIENKGLLQSAYDKLGNILGKGHA